MNFYMIGVNYQMAEIQLREKLSFTSSKTKKLLKDIKSLYDFSGAVIISTCNRTELYVSSEKCMDSNEFAQMFGEIAGVSCADLKSHFYIKENTSLIVYLFELACGIHSMIFGEDQIISQIKDSIRIANDEDSSDAALNTLFRHAITCAKKVKTNVVLRTVSPSVARQAVDILKDYITQNPHCKALVIGSGEVGRNVRSELVSLGCATFITSRPHTNTKAIELSGCKTIDYDQRQNYIPLVDILISATTSPHHTISYEMIDKCAKKPRFIIDLAMPRDIEPDVQNFKEIVYLDVDGIGKTAMKDNSNEIEIIRKFIGEEIDKYYGWEAIRNCRTNIEEIKKYAIEKITSNIDPNLSEEIKIEKAIIKTLDLVFYSLKENSTAAITQNVIDTVLARR